MWDGGAGFSCIINPTSVGENSDGKIIGKGVWNLATTDPSGGVLRLTFTVTFAGQTGIWITDRIIPYATATDSFIVLNYDTSSLSNVPVIYVNGVSVTVTEFQAPLGAKPTDIGSDLYFGNLAADSRTFDGTLDEFRLYDRPLIHDEAKALYFNPGGVTQQGVKQLGGSYKSAASGASMSFDATNGLYIQDDASNPVLQAKVTGSDVGDVIMGDTSTNYAQWDKSEGQFIINGDAGSSNMVVKGGMIQSAFTLTNFGTAGGSIPVVNQIFSGHITANNDYIFGVEQNGTAPQDSVAMRWNRTKANAVFRDLANVDVDAGAGASQYKGGCYDATYLYFIEASGAFRRLDKDLTNSVTATNNLTTAGTEQAMTFDGTYVCTLISGTNVERGTMSGATPPVYTYNDVITLSVGATGSLCWNPINSQWYAYDSGNNLIRSYNSTGTQQSTLAIRENVVGLMMLEGKLFMMFELVAPTASATARWAVQCVPFDF